MHHGWTPDTVLAGSEDPFAEVASHVLLRWASALDDAARHVSEVVTPEVIARICAMVPDAWLDPRDGFADVGVHREAYASLLRARVAALPRIVEEANRARGV